MYFKRFYRMVKDKGVVEVASIRLVITTVCYNLSLNLYPFPIPQLKNETADGKTDKVCGLLCFRKKNPN